jgi:hypothetical protein
VVYFIKEVLKVYINNVLITFADVLMALLYTLVCSFAWTKSVAVLLKLILK